MPQILYWSQTERLSWSLRLHTTQPGPPRSVVGLSTVGLLPPRAGHPFPITALRLLLKPKSGRKRHGRKARWRRLRLPSAVAFVLTLLPFRTVKCVLEGSASLSHALVGSLYININIPTNYSITIRDRRLLVTSRLHITQWKLGSMVALMGRVAAQFRSILRRAVRPPLPDCLV